jgi:CubicO group peptidase (beta-lactamase class C family)
MSKRRTEIWVALIVGVVCLIPAAILGLWVYVSVTATPLHPDPREVPSVTTSASLPKWADAVERGRQIVGTSLTEKNLPGLSVAVGVGGAIVWAEGFGWADLEKKVKVEPGTRFRIGTASTALTSAAVALLLEKGQLNLDDEIQPYVHAYPQKEWPVTLRELMGHVAGVRNDGGDEGPLLSAHCERPVEGVQAFAIDREDRVRNRRGPCCRRRSPACGKTAECAAHPRYRPAAQPPVPPESRPSDGDRLRSASRWRAGSPPT